MEPPPQVGPTTGGWPAESIACSRATPLTQHPNLIFVSYVISYDHISNIHEHTVWFKRNLANLKCTSEISCWLSRSDMDPTCGFTGPTCGSDKSAGWTCRSACRTRGSACWTRGSACWTCEKNSCQHHFASHLTTHISHFFSLQEYRNAVAVVQ